MSYKETKNTISPPNPFIRELAKYFMDFLETDFHKRRVPKRNIKLRNNDNLVVGLNLHKYKRFQNEVWSLFNNGFDDQELNKVAKGVYKTKLPSNLLKLVEKQINKISQSEVSEISEKVSDEIEKSAALHEDNFEKATAYSVKASRKIVRKLLVLPFISHLEKPLESLELGDENTLYLVEEELADVLVNLIEEEIEELLRDLIMDEEVDVLSRIKSIYELEDIKSTVDEYFQSFELTDLFSELYEINRNQSILDKQDLYLYFCDITFNKGKYPLFYIPVNLTVENNTLYLEYDSQLYINKKAVEYVVQEYNKEKGKKGKVEGITERILYLAEYKKTLPEKITSILSEMSNYFELDNEIDLSNPNPQRARSLLVRVTNSTYFALFDKSDEAIVNDYEKILQLLDSGDHDLTQGFNTLIEDFIHKDPYVVNQDVDNEWDGKDTEDKLVFNCPIPLNEEQRKILSSLNKKECKYIKVEGPPGTGKSHTITALVFDSILKDKSTLVLSDKKEALDVVGDKITNTLNKVRRDKNFQNPILRLGKTGNTYSKILSTNSIRDIKNHYKAVKRDYKELEENISKANLSLKEDIEAEILSYEDVNLEDILEYFQLKKKLKDKNIPLDLEEVSNKPSGTSDLEEFRIAILNINNELNQEESLLKRLADTYKVNINNLRNIQELLSFLAFHLKLHKKVLGLDKDYLEQISLLRYFNGLNDEHVEEFNSFIQKYEDAKQPLVGFLFSKSKIRHLNSEFVKEFLFDKPGNDPHEFLGDFKIINKFLSKTLVWKSEIEPKSILERVDYIGTLVNLVSREDIEYTRDYIKDLIDNIDVIVNMKSKYPDTAKKTKINLENMNSLGENYLVKIDDTFFNQILRYIYLDQHLQKEFEEIPLTNYLNDKVDLESLITFKMTYMLDQRLINFYDSARATAKTLREIITAKQKFPTEEFSKLKQAFPCILAGIRDYAEYIPLEPNIFDVLIIDEASQVSIAQAFPALLRAKKVVILGDNKQFSNIKATQAKSVTNRQYLNKIRNVFKESISDDLTKTERLKKFNIKTSILDFFEFISNFDIQLTKHFRGYEEIISYSNKYFYNNSLQVMKVREKPVEEVIKIEPVEHDGKLDQIVKTNSIEAEYILKQLERLKSRGSKLSVGIITPHTNQQRYIWDMINKSPHKDYFIDQLRLKVMTFDTCQGEERDIIFYSMVAIDKDDRLVHVFIKNLDSVDVEKTDLTKVQRLNVGFSRAKERMHFVLSRDIEDYTGSIGDALRHYKYTLENAKRLPDSSDVDRNSPMEKKVLNWIKQTKFFKNNSSDVELKTQFELGKYLKQLDAMYDHPEYVVDFLLSYKGSDSDHKIIIEYDGFEYHFTGNSSMIDKYNYENYYTEDDVYRQKVLESYGYKFIRLNRFNLRSNPIDELNKKIEFKISNSRTSTKIVSSIHETIDGINNGNIKECPKCKQLKNLDDFKDPSLKTGVGRFCLDCKGKKTKIQKSDDRIITQVNRRCPKCGSKMVLRSGGYGKFFGCTRYPYCKGTRNYK